MRVEAQPLQDRVDDGVKSIIDRMYTIYSLGRVINVHFVVVVMVVIV